MFYVALAAGLVIALLIVVIIALLVFAANERDANAKLLAELVRSGERERRELADRIQRPDMLPIRPMAQRRPATAEEAKRQREHAEAYAQAGRVVNAGNGDGEE